MTYRSTNEHPDMLVSLVRICSILGKCPSRVTHGSADPIVIQVVQESATSGYHVVRADFLFAEERTIWTSGQDAAIGSGGARATASVIGANTIAGSSVTGTPYTAGTPYDMPGTPYTGRR